jgi:hypothetical protein
MDGIGDRADLDEDRPVAVAFEHGDENLHFLHYE